MLFSPTHEVTLILSADGQKHGDAKSCVATQLIQALDEGDPEYEDKKAIIRDTLGSVYVGRLF